MSKIETKCVQGGWQPKNGEPRVLPIYQSTTFKYETTNDMADLFDLKASGYFYTRPGSEEALDHGGLMDTSVKGEFELPITDWMSFTAYVAYYDYLFDANMRDGARAHNSSWGEADRYRYSHNVVCGVALTATF